MTLRVLVAATAASLSVPALASDMTWSYFGGGDAAFLALTNNGTLERAVAEGRIGDNLIAGTWERGLWVPQGGVGSPVAQGGFVWPNGSPRGFEVTWDGINTISFSINGQTLSSSLISGPFTDIFLRVRSTTNASVDLTDMDLNGKGIGDLGSSGNTPAGYIRIKANSGPFGAFVLKGNAELKWSTQPSGSSLAFQVKFTNVPTPAAAGLLALGGLVAARRRRA